MCAFNSEVSISSNPLGLIRIKLIVLQSQMLHSTWPPCWIAQHGAQHSHSCGRTCEINYSPVSHLPTQGYETWLYSKSAPPISLVALSSLCLSLYIFSGMFWSFSLMIVLQIVFLLFFFWEEVSSWSFYSTIVVDPSRLSLDEESGWVWLVSLLQLLG